MLGMTATALDVQDFKLRAAAYNLKINLMSARSQAIKRNEDISAQINSSQDAYNATTDDGQILYSVKLEDNINIVTNNNPITFKPLGTATNSVLYVRNNSKEYEINVNAVGQVSIN